MRAAATSQPFGGLVKCRLSQKKEQYWDHVGNMRERDGGVEQSRGLGIIALPRLPAGESASNFDPVN